MKKTFEEFKKMTLDLNKYDTSLEWDEFNEARRELRKYRAMVQEMVGYPFCHYNTEKNAILVSNDGWHYKTYYQF